MLLICFFCAVGISYLFRDLFLYFVYRKSQQKFYIFLSKKVHDADRIEQMLRAYCDFGLGYNKHFCGFATVEPELYSLLRPLFDSYGIELSLF